MKSFMKMIAIVFAASIMFTSCYSYTSVVGSGSQGTEQKTQWNHYIIYGLIPIGVSDSKQMAEGDTDYTVHTRHSILNGLLAAITFGIYTPTTTTVTK